MQENGQNHEQGQEQEIRASVDSPRAHILYAAVEQNLLNPDNKTVTTQQTESLKTATAENLPWQAANGVSMDSREAFYDDDIREFDVQVKDWNESVANWVDAGTMDTNTDPSKDVTIAALASVGIDVSDRTNLTDQVDQFRTKYLGEDESNIKQFAQDLGEGCKKNDGSIDMNILHARLDKIKPLLDTFGHENDVAEIVSDMVVARGTLTQKADAKNQIAQAAAFQIARPTLTDSEHTRLKALWEQQQHLNTKPPEAPAAPERKKEQEFKAGQRIIGKDGVGYQLLTGSKDGTLVAKPDNGPLTSGDDLLDKIKGGTLDTVQRGMKVTQTAGGKEYTVMTITTKDADGPKVILKDADNKTISIPIEDFRNEIATEGSPWKIAKEEDTAKVDVQEALRVLKERDLPETEESYGPEYALKSIKARSKSQKEDSMLVEGDLMAILDGVGSSERADKAAQAVQNFLRQETQQMPQGLSLDETKEWLENVIKNAHKHIFDLRAADPTFEIGQTTLGVALNYRNTHRLTTVIGDSNMYELSNGKLESLNINPEIENAAHEMLVLQKLAKEQDPTGGTHFDVAKFAQECGVDLSEMIQNFRFERMKESYDHMTQSDTNPLTLEQYAHSKGIDLKKVLQTDASYIDAFKLLLPDTARGMGSHINEILSYHDTAEFTEEGMLDVSQPITKQRWQIIGMIASQKDETLQELKMTIEAINGSPELTQETKRLQRVLGNIDADTRQETLPNGRIIGKLDNYHDTETGLAVSQRLVELYGNRNVMTTALGAESSRGGPKRIEPDIRIDQLDPSKPSVLITCTDGVDDNLTQVQMEAILTGLNTADTITSDQLKKTTETMVDAAYEFYNSDTNQSIRMKPDDITFGIRVTNPAEIATSQSEQETPLPVPHVLNNQRYAGADGKMYEVVSLGQELPLAIRGEDNTLVIGNEAVKIITNATVQEEEQQKEEAAEATELEGIIGGMGEGVKEAAKGIRKKEQQVANAAQKLKRPLSSAERSLITHGGSVDELEQVIRAKLAMDSQKAYHDAQTDGTSTTHVRGPYDASIVLQQLEANTDTQMSADTVEGFKQVTVGFSKARELGADPRISILLNKTDGKIIPYLAVSIMAQKQDGTPLTTNEHTAVVQAIRDAQENENVVEESVLTEPETKEKISDQPLTPELAQRDPETFKLLLIQKLGEKHPIAGAAWDHVMEKFGLSLEKVTIDTSGFMSRNREVGIKLGVEPLPADFKNKTHFDDASFTYEDEVLYRFSHEVSHNLAFELTNSDDQAIPRLIHSIMTMRESNDMGFSALGSLDFYKSRGAETQAKEDITELINMYLWNPDYFKQFTDFLADPQFAQERQRLNLGTLQEDSKVYVIGTIENAVKSIIPTAA